MQKLEHALNNMEQFKHRIMGKKVIFFLDYDGTLKPIVDKPENAIL